MKKNKRLVPGIVTIAVLLVITMMVNVLMSTFGTTLTSYLGTSSSGTTTSGDDETSYDEMDLLAEGREIVTELEGEGAVLLRNENNTLPLEKGTKVTILGAMSYNYINGGTGSAGGKYDEYTYSMYEAFTGTKDDGSDSTSTEMYLDVNEKAWEWLEQAVGGGRNMDTTEDYYGHTGTGEITTFSGSDYAENKDAYGNGDWGGYTQVCEFAYEVYERDKDDFMEDGYNDVVIVTFGRSGAEGASPTAVGAQSSVDTEDGGKTGLSSVAASLGFLVALFAWIFTLLFATKTNGAGMWVSETETKLAYYVQDAYVFADLIMVLVGASMLKGIRKVDTARLAEMLPFAAAVVGIGLLSNIAIGVALGAISYVIVMAVSKERKNLTAGNLVLAVCMLVYLILALI